MRRLLTVLAAFALVAMLVFIAMTVDVSLNGAFITNSIERFPGAQMVVAIGSAVTLIGLLALLGATILGVVQTARRHQWGWLLLILILLPVAGASMLSAGFVANIALALLTLVSPLALLLYSLRGDVMHTTALAA